MKLSKSILRLAMDSGINPIYRHEMIEAAKTAYCTTISRDISSELNLSKEDTLKVMKVLEEQL